MALPSTGYATATVNTPSSALSDFTLAVDLSTMPASWWSAVDTSDGTKGRAAKDAGPTELAADWIDFDDTAGTGWLRVKWDGTLASTGTQTLRIYPPKSANASYAAGDTYGSNNAYDTSWEGYWPLHDLNDRTSHDLNLTANGGVTVGGTTGKVGKATDFDGSNDNLSVTLTWADNQQVTVLYWNNVASSQIQQSNAFGVVGGSGSSDRLHSHSPWSDGNIYWDYGNFNGSGRISTSYSAMLNKWSHVGLVSEGEGGSYKAIFFDGSEETSSTSSDGPDGITSREFAIGTVPQRPEYHRGKIEDFQLHSTRRSAGWISHEYDQTNDNSTFWGTWTWNSSTTTGPIGGANRRRRVLIGA